MAESVAGDGDAAGVAVGVALLPPLSVELCAGVPVVDAGGVPVLCTDDVAAGVVASLVDVSLVDVGAVGDGLEDWLGVVGGVEGGAALSVLHCQIVGLEFTFPETTPDPPPPLVEARVCGAMAAAVMTSPAAVVSKTAPALRPIDAGRTRAKHM